MVRPRIWARATEEYTLTWAQAMKEIAVRSEVKVSRPRLVQADYMNVRWGVQMDTDGRLYNYNPALGGKYPFEADARARGAMWRVMKRP